MNTTLKIFLMLLGTTLFFNVSMNFMADNIEDYENVALPPKKIKKFKTSHPVIKVDAQSRDAWTLVDFSSGEIHHIKDPDDDKVLLASLDWDIGFQRTKVITNGGETNPKGPVGVLNMGAQKFDDVSQIPSVDFVQDKRAWGAVTNKSLVDWYLYRTRTHNIESKKNVYLVQTGDGHLKMRIINYYCTRLGSECNSMMCTREEAACLTIEYQHIAQGIDQFPLPPAPTQTTAQVAP